MLTNVGVAQRSLAPTSHALGNTASLAYHAWLNGTMVVVQPARSQVDFIVSDHWGTASVALPESQAPRREEGIRHGLASEGLYMPRPIAAPRRRTQTRPLGQGRCCCASVSFALAPRRRKGDEVQTPNRPVPFQKAPVRRRHFCGAARPTSRDAPPGAPLCWVVPGALGVGGRRVPRKYITERRAAQVFGQAYAHAPPPPREALEGGEVPPPPHPGRPAYAQPLSR